MSAEYTCDGCSKKASGTREGQIWAKPRSWFQRSDEEGIQDACSRECIEMIAEKTGKTEVTLPW